ncbi:MAG: TfoX/Sxy family protein [Bryobacteraceae bacterium]
MEPIKNQPSYVAFIVEHLSAMGEITVKKLFGGHCLYCGGVVFALIARNTLYLKADSLNQPAFIEQGLKAFNPFDRPNGLMPYYTAPVEIFEDEDALKFWVGGAIQAGRRSKKAKKR